jgi:predicted permease
LGLEITFLNKTQRWYTCDDNWSLFLYETGYVGLLLIGALLFSAALYALRTRWMFRDKQGAMSGIFFVCLVCFYFLMISVAAYSWGQQGYMAWILISLAVSHRRILLRERALEQDQRRSQRELNTSRQHTVPELVHAPG